MPSVAVSAVASVQSQLRVWVKTGTAPLKRPLPWLHRMEDWLLTLLALILVGLSVGQILARVFADSGIPHSEALLKTTVLWLAMFGAMTAAREGKHLGMDALLHAFPASLANFCKMLGFAFAAWVSFKFCQYGYQFVLFERENPSSGAELLPSWVVLCAFPIGFGGMALRFTIHALKSMLFIGQAPHLDADDVAKAEPGGAPGAHP